jgi:hypothetical protein
VSRMYSYKQNINRVQEMLNGFVKTKVIDIKQLTKLDSLIKQSEQDQIRTLNSSLPLDIQRTMFGAVRNMNTSIKGMKERLRTASLRHENPTTAEQALEMMEILSNVAYCIDAYSNERRITDVKDIEKLSRILYRKAKHFGFSEDPQTQLRDAGITVSQVESFIDHFDNNLSQEIDIEEEVHSNLESSN